jgi:Ca-activated chloride channel family protein
VDVAIVMDASTSMGQPDAGGAPKIRSAASAVGVLLDQLDFEHDQVALVTFHNRAILAQPLTSDRAALETALGAIQLETESRLDLGVAMAREELLGDRSRPRNQPAMVVLTDGRANPVPASAAVTEAAAAKAAGVTVFTIGVGDDVDTDALRDMATSPRYFYAAPDARSLVQIYVEISRDIPCRTGVVRGAIDLRGRTEFARAAPLGRQSRALAPLAF